MSNHLYALDSSIVEICEKNESFDSGVLRIAYHGDNRNGSSISKDVFEKCISTIHYCPIVCNYERDANDIGGHDVDIVKDEDGSLKIVNITTPVGVIPESTDYWWEEVVENDGTSHEYICVNALLWKRQEEYEKIKSDIFTNQSMEIKIVDSHMKDGVMVIDSFEFMALCLLGSEDEPCYESASLEMFTTDYFHLKYVEMLSDLKRDIKKVITSPEDDINNQNFSKKGEDQMEQQKIELLNKFGLSADELDFDVESMSLEELEAKLNEQHNAIEEPENEEFTAEDEVVDPMAEEPEQVEMKASMEGSLTVEQVRDGLLESLRTIKMTDEDGYEYNQYMYIDFCYETNEVFCHDLEDGNLYGFAYSVNGDVVSVDFACKKRKKFAIVDFVEGEYTFDANAAFEEFAENKVADAKAEFDSKLADANELVSTMSVELEELRAFQSNAIKEERAEMEKALFESFEDIDGVEAFEELKQNCSDMSIEEIEEKCFAIRGRNMFQKFSVRKEVSTRVPIEKNHDAHNNDPYGGLFEQYPPTNRY